MPSRRSDGSAPTYSYWNQLSILNIVVLCGKRGKPVDNFKASASAVPGELHSIYPQIPNGGGRILHG